MNRAQRLRYEMFVRVRNFGAVNRDVFPESSDGGQAFAVLAEAAAAIEEHLTRRAGARAQARKVRSNTRAAVTGYMKAIAATGRRAADADAVVHPFRMPSRKSAAVVLSTARLFMEEAERRKESFVRLGMSPTFITDFRRLVQELELAISVQQDSRSSRHKAQAGIEESLSRGYDVIRDLDVTIANVLRGDPVRLAQWHGARHVEGQGSSSDTFVVPATAPVTTTPDQPSADPPVAEAASPPAALETKEVTSSQARDHILDKAS